MATSEDKITVYYVTATTVRDRSADRPRIDLAKFFNEADAEDHRARLGKAWISTLVEPRQERVDEQHEAHRDALRARVKR